MAARSVLPICLALALVAMPLAAAPVAAGENPHNRDCEALNVFPTTIWIVFLCAGADAGGNGGCENLSQKEISCWYSYSWNLLAESPIGAPGEAELEWSWIVTSCIDQDCEILEQGEDGFECSWTLPTETCGERHMAEGGKDYVLELGQCVTVIATASARTAAWVPEQDGTVIWEAEISDSSGHGGAACALDDGRD